VTPAPSPIRGSIISINSWRCWHWVVSRPGMDGEAGDALDWGESTSLPAAYDRCAAAVRKAREEA